MHVLLALVGLLLPLEVQAEAVRVFDQVCVAEQIRTCLHETCPIGQLKLPDVNSNFGRIAGQCTSPDQHTALPERFALCEKLVQISLAPANCVKTIDPPTAGQLDTFNSKFNENFIRALEKAFPTAKAESAASQTPSPAPAKP